MNTPNPAPWTYENVEDRADRSAYGVVKDANGRILFDNLNADPTYAAEIMREDDGEGGVNYYDLQAEANLTLVAAAPVMRALLGEVAAIYGDVERYGGKVDPNGLLARIRAVITKVGGRS